MIKITGLNKYYYKNKSNENHVLNDINITFEDKGLVTIFGPSGSGKTTLLNVIGLMDKFDSGSITIDDQTFKSYKPNIFDELRNKKIGYIFQNYNLIDSLNVYDNVALPLSMLGITDKDEIDKRVMYSLEKVGLDKYKRRNSQMLSGGQMQRVAIARAIAKNPDVIIADEPTGNLDSNNTFEIMNIIKKISMERLVILVSHEKDLVEFYSDRIIEIKDGKIISDKENVGGELNRTDSRNIYLKDYKNITSSNEDVDINVYTDSARKEKCNLDFVIRNNEIFIRSNQNMKIHVVDEYSETKLIDASEEEFKEKIKNATGDFALDELGDANPDGINKKGYITVFKAIKDGFKNRSGFLQKKVFTAIAFIITTLIFAFIFSALYNSLTFTKKDYLLSSNDTISVSISNSELKNGKNGEHLKEILDNDPNVVSVRNDLDSYYSSLVIKCDLFYQSSGSLSSYAYMMKNGRFDYKITHGRGITSDEEIVISKWIAESFLKSNYAAANGIDSMEDLIGRKVYYSGGWYNSGNYLTVCGISNDESYSAYVAPDKFDDIITVNYVSTYYYIDTVNKEETMSRLSEYKTVLDSVKDGRRNYFKSVVEDNIGKIIGLGVITIALALYIILMSRSSMFKMIKNIGILRTVGAKKKDIINIFIGDMFALTTKSSLIAYVVANLLILFTKIRLNLSNFGMSLLAINPISFFLGIILIYALNIFAAIIPIMILNHKTPIEVVKKYDI